MRKLLKNEVETYVDKLKDKVVQEDNKTIIGGNLEVDGTIISNTKVESDLITGNEIVEKMSGYSFIQGSKDGLTLTPVYCSAVKTGNKLTLVIFGKAQRSGDVASDFAEFGAFIIPNSVAEKIYPTALGSQTNAVLSKTIQLFSFPSSKIDCNMIVNKYDNRLQTYVYEVNNLQLNIEYQYRIEMTFLLSDNLAV